MAPYVLAVTALTVHYITYVLTRSDFPPVRWARESVVEAFGEGSAPAYLVTCAYCTAFYVAGLVTLALAVADAVRLPVLLWLGTASFAGSLVEVIDAVRSVALKNSATVRTLNG